MNRIRHATVMKTYACSYVDCQRVLSTAYNLKKHVEAHHLHLKPFKCGRCLQTFAYKHSLKHHYLSHLPLDWTQIESTVTRCEITIPKLTELMNKGGKKGQVGETKFPAIPFPQLPSLVSRSQTGLTLPNIFNC